MTFTDKIRQVETRCLLVDFIHMKGAAMLIGGPLLFYQGGIWNMQNPVTEIRERHGLTRTQLAILASMDVVSVKRIERGDAAKLSGRLLETLVTLGGNKNELIRGYGEWRSEAARKVLSGIGA